MLTKLQEIDPLLLAEELIHARLRCIEYLSFFSFLPRQGLLESSLVRFFMSAATFAYDERQYPDSTTEKARNHRSFLLRVALHLHAGILLSTY